MSTTFDQDAYDHLTESVSFDMADVDKATLCQASYYNSVCEEVAHSLTQFKKIQLEVEKVEAETEIRIRGIAAAKGEKTTEASIKAQVNIDPFLFKLKHEEIEKEAEYQKWVGLRRSWEMRAESLKIMCQLVKSQFPIC